MLTYAIISRYQHDPTTCKVRKKYTPCALGSWLKASSRTPLAGEKVVKRARQLSPKPGCLCFHNSLHYHLEIRISLLLVCCASVLSSIRAGITSCTSPSGPQHWYDVLVLVNTSDVHDCFPGIWKGRVGWMEMNALRTGCAWH